jgi:hypothetical protein
MALGPGIPPRLAALPAPLHEPWVGGEFDPEAFDVDEVNRELQRLK